MPNFIRRVRQVANERWDLPDAANAIMELVAEGIARAEAGDLGVAEGVLSRSEVTFEEPSPGVFQLRFGGCLLYGCKPDDTPSNLSTAAPIVYDPTNPNQIQSTVDITSIENGEGSIWWSVELVPYELANRRIWEEGYPDGRNQPINTRMYPRVTFSLVSGANFNTPPGVGGPWYRFAAVDFNDEPPTTVLCHALDYGFELTAFDVAAQNISRYYWLGQVAIDYRSALNNSGRSYSLSRAVTELALAYLATLDSTNVFDVTTGELTTAGGSTLITRPSNGVVQLGVQVAAATGRLDTLESQYQLAYWGEFNDDNTLVAEGGDAMDAGWVASPVVTHTIGTGIYVFTFSAALAASTAALFVTSKPNDTTNPDSFTREAVSSTVSFNILTYNSGGTLSDRRFKVQVFASSTDY